TSWRSFIPTDDDNSSHPAGAIEYMILNMGTASVDAVFSFNAKNFLQVENGKNSINKMANSFILSENGTKEKPFKSDFAIFTNDASAVIDYCWFRGSWWDPVTMAWNTVKNAGVKSVDP